MINYIKVAVTLIALPYFCFFEFLRGGDFKGNSGHTSGIGDGLLWLTACVSFIVQALIAIILTLVGVGVMMILK